MKILAKITAGAASLAVLLLTTACPEQTKNTYDRYDQLASNDTMKKSKIIMVFTNHGVQGGEGENVEPTGYTLAEAAEPYIAFSQAGYTVDFVSPQGGQPQPDKVDLSTEANKLFWNDPDVQRKLQNTLKPEDIKIADYMGLFFVGGHGAMWDFPDDPDLNKLTRDIYENRGGIVGAVCHGPAALVNVKLSTGKYLVSGMKIAAFTNAEEKAKGMDSRVPFLLESKLKEQGAQVITAPADSVNVQITDRLVTGQNKPSARKTADEMIRLLNEIAAR